MIEVRKIQTLFAACKKALVASLGSHYFGFERKSGSAIYYGLVGSNQTEAVAGDTRYSVLPLTSESEPVFWLALEMNVISNKASYNVSNISLVFFEGISSDSEKNPLIRAEWDSWTDPQHAQPHWHVYPYGLKLTGLGQQASFVQDNDVQEFGIMLSAVASNSKRLPIEKFHFPMLSAWHLNPPPPDAIQFSEVSVCHWIGACVLYTSRQLAYIKRG